MRGKGKSDKECMQPAKTPFLAAKQEGWKPEPGTNADQALKAQRPMKYNEESHGGGLVHHPSHKSDKHHGLVHRQVKRPPPHKEAPGMPEESMEHEKGETAEDEAAEHT